MEKRGTSIGTVLLVFLLVVSLLMNALLLFTTDWPTALDKGVVGTYSTDEDPRLALHLSMDWEGNYWMWYGGEAARCEEGTYENDAVENCYRLYGKGESVPSYLIRCGKDAYLITPDGILRFQRDGTVPTSIGSE